MAAVLMTLLIFSSLNVYFAVITQSDLKNKDQEEKNTRDWERENEKVRIVSISIESNQKPNATVANEGAVPVVLADLWVRDLTINTSRVYNLSQMRDLIIQPGFYKINIGQNINSTPPITLNSLHTYEIRIYTKRGNVAEQTYIPTNPETPVGPFYFSFDRESFNYTTSNAGSGTAWEIRCSSSYRKRNIIFLVKFTNHGDRSIEISHLSHMMVVKPYSDYVEDEYYFHILNNTSTSTAPVAYEDYSQVVPANPQNKEVGVSQIIMFGATKPSSSTLQEFPIPGVSSSSYNDRKYLYLVWIGIFWRWEGSDEYYGINVPFTGIRVWE
jgi:hypothetical protein